METLESAKLVTGGFAWCDETKRLTGEFLIGDGTAGYYRTIHEGCICTIANTAMILCAFQHIGEFVVTENLTLNSHEHIRLGSTVHVRSKVQQIEGRRVYIDCELLDDDGMVYTDVKGVFMRNEVDYISRLLRWACRQ